MQIKVSPGTRPGTVQSPVDAERSKIRVIAYNQGNIEDVEINDVKQITPLLQRWSVVWINVDGLGDARKIQQLGQLFGLHPLAQEDVVNLHQRAKVEPYDNHVYIVVRMPSASPDHHTEQISLFFGKNFVLTFQERSGDSFDPIREALRNPDSRMRKGSQADYLAYRIIDALVDSYFPLLEEYGDTLDNLDETITRAPHPHVFNELHQVKSEIVLLRRASWPLRDTIRQLSQESISPLISDTTRVFWRDCHDHAIHVIDLVEMYREICGDLRDFYLTTISNRMNEIMKVLTIIATIFIPLGFVAGVYGMNFNTEESPWNMPELDWYFGYPLCIGLMSTVAGIMLVFFWRRGWIGPDRDPPKLDDSLPRNQSE
jgi:magnesium transporter